MTTGEEREEEPAVPPCPAGYFHLHWGCPLGEPPVDAPAFLGMYVAMIASLGLVALNGKPRLLLLRPLYSSATVAREELRAE